MDDEAVVVDEQRVDRDERARQDSRLPVAREAPREDRDHHRQQQSARPLQHQHRKIAIPEPAGQQRQQRDVARLFEGVVHRAVLRVHEAEPGVDVGGDCRRLLSPQAGHWQEGHEDRNPRRHREQRHPDERATLAHRTFAPRDSAMSSGRVCHSRQAVIAQ